MNLFVTQDLLTGSDFAYFSKGVTKGVFLEQIKNYRFPLPSDEILTVIFDGPNKDWIISFKYTKRFKKGIDVVNLGPAGLEELPSCDIINVKTGFTTKVAFDGDEFLYGGQDLSFETERTVISIFLTGFLALMMLLSEDYAVESVTPSPLQKKRYRKTKLPADDYYILKPKPRVLREETPESEPSDIHQRYHLRRGHWRQYKCGKRIFVKAYHAGDKNLGIIHKDYKI
jgi:hypothetical protein